MVNLQDWIKRYEQAITGVFGSRVLFIGIQGSYAREEANENSDIDIVLILDQIHIHDLRTYKQILSHLPEEKRICGFVSGKEELSHWAPYDLFQFYTDTLPICGNLDDIIAKPTTEQARAALQAGACNIYHACSHNYIHAMDHTMLQALYKNAFFVIQAKLYYEQGYNCSSRREASRMCQKEDSTILETSSNPQVITDETLEKYSQILLDWTSRILCNL